MLPFPCGRTTNARPSRSSEDVPYPLDSPDLDLVGRQAVEPVDKLIDLRIRRRDLPLQRLVLIVGAAVGVGGPPPWMGVLSPIAAGLPRSSSSRADAP